MIRKILLLAFLFSSPIWSGMALAIAGILSDRNALTLGMLGIIVLGIAALFLFRDERRYKRFTDWIGR